MGDWRNNKLRALFDIVVVANKLFGLLISCNFIYLITLKPLT